MKKDEMEKRSYQFDVRAEKRADGVNTIAGSRSCTHPRQTSADGSGRS